ncbi:alpha/beta hydrolase [Erythrobacter sp. JK5]|uniref:alpha/beta hydrolase n=1 Tax=Erythrobacter sp. JK5 TaxID=2829500 RepID=UPI001BAD30CC|nr:alpha/beta hydrolase [Erythrobacter sp. JK5]QUL36506.1 alpha/beta hydrolase [Erythrobacter sp. JK5]
MNRLATALVAGLATMLIAAPILAQRSDRPSRECVREIVQLCGRDRSKIRSCLQEKASQLSEGCAAEVRERAQQRGQRGRRSRDGAAGGQFQSSAKIDRTIFYGQHQRQQIDVYEPDDAVDELPMIIFIHGGGWSFGNHKTTVQNKPNHFNGNGYYFASTGYRLLPDAPVEQQAQDIGAAIRALRGQASAIGFDPDRIVLMGHSAGAHLAALVATDPQYAGDAFAAIKGVVLLDGAGYDVTAIMADPAPQAAQIYRTAFGNDPARQAALSPVTHVGGRDAPNWLALYVEERDRAKVQAEMLVAGLQAAGANAEAVAIAGTDHGRMNRELGTEDGAEQTSAVGRFLASTFDG